MDRMFLTSENYHYVRISLLGLAILSSCGATGDKYEGESCETNYLTPGICRLDTDCPELKEAVELKKISNMDPVHCSYWKLQEVICCPIEQPPPTDSNGSSFGGRSGERPAIAACMEIEKNLSPGLTPHILDGTPVAVGEYPHMAAIGYLRDGANSSKSYEFICGGTLISNKFVISAAHCVSMRETTPSIVRLGAANFSNPRELAEALEIRIKTIYKHEDYSSLKRKNDVALFELEHEVPAAHPRIYPSCLHTDTSDPPPGSKLYVTGWGAINATAKEKSNQLLKARLEIMPTEDCNKEFSGIRGLTAQDLCAYDVNNTKDSCYGDSGGPLNWVINDDSRNFRLVGIISTGFGCGGAAPGLYMRVSSYLDFIERIVWP